MSERLDFALRRDFPGFAFDAAAALPLKGVTAVFGPSGGGKSTLLRALAGLEPAEGHIRFGAEAWLGGARPVPTHKRGVGYVFQDARLFDHLSVQGNLDYAARRSRASAPERAAAVEALDLGPLLGRRPGGLSGGERQRVAIARALLTRPRLLLMDEPLSALDRRRKAAILPHIAEAAALSGAPVLYVTHAVDEVAQLASRVLLMEDGRVTAEGPAGEILSGPAFEHAAGRFEAGALVEAEVTGHDRAVRLTRLTLCGQPLSMPMLGALEAGTKVRLRVRARDVALAVRRPEGVSIRNILAGRVAEMEVEEDTAFAELAVDLGGQLVRARVTREAAAELQLAVGAEVFALVKSISFDRRGMPPPPE
ncbi:molybdenum ABC transporter ATP-binding protein [Rhodovulum sp. DZ06]|uniref:molybdenum ABC transporter ATP-binding protein n=1 Tax=Rhodovulum sp. DZ06 TaxID=3425126 RepID=UPI003D349A77